MDILFHWSLHKTKLSGVKSGERCGYSTLIFCELSFWIKMCTVTALISVPLTLVEFVHSSVSITSQVVYHREEEVLLFLEIKFSFPYMRYFCYHSNFLSRYTFCGHHVQHNLSVTISSEKIHDKLREIINNDIVAYR